MFLWNPGYILGHSDSKKKSFQPSVSHINICILTFLCSCKRSKIHETWKLVCVWLMCVWALNMHNLRLLCSLHFSLWTNLWAEMWRKAWNTGNRSAYKRKPDTKQEQVSVWSLRFLWLIQYWTCLAISDAVSSAHVTHTVMSVQRCVLAVIRSSSLLTYL